MAVKVPVVPRIEDLVVVPVGCAAPAGAWDENRTVPEQRNQHTTHSRRNNGETPRQWMQAEGFWSQETKLIHLYRQLQNHASESAKIRTRYIVMEIPGEPASTKPRGSLKMGFIYDS